MTSISGILVLLVTLAFFVALPLVIYYAAKGDKPKDSGPDEGAES